MEIFSKLFNLYNNKSQFKYIFGIVSASSSLIALSYLLYKKFNSNNLLKIDINIDYQQNIEQWKNKKIQIFDESFEQIIINDKEKLAKKVKQIKLAGLNNFQVISDFDQTVTSFKYKNEPSYATFGVLRKNKNCDKLFQQRTEKYFQKYHPIEIDSTVSRQEKRKLMNEWHTFFANAFRDAHFKKDFLVNCLNDAQLALRFAYEDFFKLCQDNYIPYFIVSAGFQLMIQSILSSVSDIKLYKQLFIASNKVIYDQTGENIINIDMSINAVTKSEVLNNRTYQKFKKNAILLGDMDTDYYSAVNLKLDNQISILFLRDNMKKDLEDLKKRWDIIITGDGSYIVPIFLMRQLFDEQLFVDENVELFNIWSQDERYKEIRMILESQ